MKYLALILALAILPVLAQQPSAPKPAVKAEVKPEAKPAPPVPTDASLHKFFKAQSQVLQAQQAVDQTQQGQVLKQRQAEFQKAIDELQALCGKDYVLGMNPQSGDPFCLARTETAPAAKK